MTEFNSNILFTGTAAAVLMRSGFSLYYLVGMQPNVSTVAN